METGRALVVCTNRLRLPVSAIPLKNLKDNEQKE